jgi:hypothetical protein
MLTPEIYSEYEWHIYILNCGSHLRTRTIYNHCYEKDHH